MKIERTDIKTPDALLFDMDGTLWDAVETYTKAWNTYFKKIKLDKLLSKTDLDHLMGLEERKFLEAVLPEFTADQRALSYKQVVEIQYDLIDQQGGRIYEGVLKYIPLLSEKYKLFIISNCPKYTIDHFMKFAKINPYILDSISHGQNYKAKYQNMNRLIEKYNLRSPVYIGDTNSDMIQSRKAGIPFIFMSYGFGDCDQADKTFASFEDFAIYYLGERNDNN